MLQPDPRFDAIVQCPTLKDAVKAADPEGPWLFVVDLTLPDASHTAAVERLHEVAPNAAIVVFAADVSRRTVDAAFAAGARGFVPKGAPTSTLMAAIDMVLRGETFVPKEVLSTWAGSSPAPGSSAARLTPRQEDVLFHLARGLANKAIATELGMSPSTVRVHVSAIFRALGVDNRTQAAVHPAAHALLAARASE